MVSTATKPAISKWDIKAFGNFYVSGLNAGDYDAHILLETPGQVRASVIFQVGFENANRTPSFVFDTTSSLDARSAQLDLNKENSTHIYCGAGGDLAQKIENNGRLFPCQQLHLPEGLLQSCTGIQLYSMYCE